MVKGFHKASLVLLGLVALVSLLPLLGPVAISDYASTDEGVVKRQLLSNLGNNTSLTRKLLLSNDGGEDMNRVGQSRCRKDSISVNQGPAGTNTDGIPIYSVHIVNVCTTGCSIFNIRVSCGEFSSATLVNPNVFRRIMYNMCLVNDGGVLRAGDSLLFDYTNTFPYPLSVSNVNC